MREEIKEMIDKIKKCLIAGYDLDIITQEEMGILWNYITNLQEENKRLNNIIDEFDKWLIGEKMMFYKSDDGERLIRFGETKNKWLELKGDNK